MPRSHTVTFKGVLVAAPQDLVAIYGASIAGSSSSSSPGGVTPPLRMLRILRQWWGCTDTTAPTDQQLQIESGTLLANVTQGSGGSIGTPQKIDPGDANGTFTAHVNDTTGAASSSSFTQLEEHGDNVKAGYDYMFPKPPIVGPAEAFVFRLLSTPSGTVHLSGGILLEEIGG